MPSVSLAQEHFFGMSGTAKGRKALRSYGMKPAPVKVAKDFNNADRGKHFPKAKPKSVAEVHGK